MAIEKGTFETLIPSQFISFTFPNPNLTKTLALYGPFLRIAVLDSHLQTSDPPQIAAMLVPKDRENDWVFNTKSGHAQLLLSSPGISRLILVGNLSHDEDDFPVIYNRPVINVTEYMMKFEESLVPLLTALSPKMGFINGFNEIPFLTYEDSLISCLMVEKCIGSSAGEMLVEDIEIENLDELDGTPVREFRRRLRFKRMPNLVQTQIRIIPDTINMGSVDFRIEEMKFRPDTSCLVHPYLPPMVASLSLIAGYLEQQINSSSNPRILCVGIGGGALLTFLNSHFGFEVFGVENDEIVVKVAKSYFGLVESEFLRIIVGDGIDVIKAFGMPKGIDVNMGSNGYLDSKVVCGKDDCKFDVIMVDLDSSDVIIGSSAPPLEFVQHSVLLAAKMALCSNGILAMNVIPTNRSFYEMLICELQKVFSELYEINVGNEENYVLIASVTPIQSVYDDIENSILKKLKSASLEQYMVCMRKL